ncbi:MAG TPA: hypothetical protein VFF30_14360 [Nitrososphaerales archaeon]|nr:hypothetical protein [Nitrososphaerales archaeon]
MADRTVLVLGGGIGGLVPSNSLRKELGAPVKVTLIERKKNFQFPHSYPWLMLGREGRNRLKEISPPLETKVSM